MSWLKDLTHCLHWNRSDRFSLRSTFKEKPLTITSQQICRPYLTGRHLPLTLPCTLRLPLQASQEIPSTTKQNCRPHKIGKGNTQEIRQAEMGARGSESIWTSMCHSNEALFLAISTKRHFLFSLRKVFEIPTGVWNSHRHHPKPEYMRSVGRSKTTGEGGKGWPSWCGNCIKTLQAAAIFGNCPIWWRKQKWPKTGYVPTVASESHSCFRQRSLLSRGFNAMGMYDKRKQHESTQQQDNQRDWIDPHN